MKIVVDENITLGKEAFSNFGEVLLYPGRKITNDVVADADVLIVRSITNVNEGLLKHSSVKFVGTATIGFDHIDIDYLNSKNIFFTTAAGCNSFAVAEYVMSSLAYFIKQEKYDLSEKTIGIIGVGNIGKIVERFSKSLGLNVVLNDPPLKRKTGDDKYRPIKEALNCDIVTLHVPLNKMGIDKTVHLINEEKLNLIKPKSILINSCRGPVVDNQALKKRIKNKNDLYTCFDVWENEPKVDLELLKLVNLATAHIAGYSYEGKINGTSIIAEKLNHYLNTQINWRPDPLYVSNPELNISSFNANEFLLDVFNHTYKIENDSINLKNHNQKTIENLADYFDRLRKNYPFRRELLNYSIKNKYLKESEKQILKTFRIQVREEE